MRYNRRGDSDTGWLVIGASVVLVALIVCNLVSQVSQDSQKTWQLEAIQYGYGRFVNGKFEWVPPAEWSAATREHVNQRIDALVPEVP